MTQVFISYASQDRAHAQRLAQALEARGYGVWWDRDLIAGQHFDKAIEQALESADCAVVLWSSHAVTSDWVRGEASAAAERDALVPAWIEAVKLPLEFRRRHTVDLTAWQGQTQHPDFDELCRGIDARREGARLAAAARVDPLETRPDVETSPVRVTPAGLAWRWRAGAMVTLLVGLGVMWSLWRMPAPASQPAEPAARSSAVSVTTPGASAIAQGATLAELLHRAAGSYYGEIQSDTQGPSRSGVTVTVTKLDDRSIRLAGDHPRLGSVDVSITQATGHILVNADGDTNVYLSLDAKPPQLHYAPRGELVYLGSRTPDAPAMGPRKDAAPARP